MSNYVRKADSIQRFGQHLHRVFLSIYFESVEDFRPIEHAAGLVHDSSRNSSCCLTRPDIFSIRMGAGPLKIRLTISRASSSVRPRSVSDRMDALRSPATLQASAHLTRSDLRSPDARSVSTETCSDSPSFIRSAYRPLPCVVGTTPARPCCRRVTPKTSELTNFYAATFTILGRSSGWASAPAGTVSAWRIPYTSSMAGRASAMEKPRPASVSS